MFLIFCKQWGWLLDFDGEDFRWIDNQKAAWKMSALERQMAFNRLTKEFPKVEFQILQKRNCVE